MEPIWSLGLMSGTSLDGVDAAWLLTNGRTIEEVGGGFTVPYPPCLKDKIRRVLGSKKITPEIQALERELTTFHAQVVRLAQESHPYDVVGFHGHTIYHAPPKTCQIGDGKRLAREVGVDVVYDFRSADVLHGGQGAPLVPIFHQAISPGRSISAIVNIGGVANISWIHKGHGLIAFDTGPGGALIDDWILRKSGKPYDYGGQLAEQGTVNTDILDRWLEHPYFSKSVPKSLDRDEFSTFLKDIELLSLPDGAATLVEFTARSIVRGLSHTPSKPQKLFVSGGGRRNTHLMNRLKVLTPCFVDTVESLGWDGDLLEAYAFAYLAVRFIAGLPTSFPTTTGVDEPVCGGQWASAREKILVIKSK